MSYQQKRDSDIKLVGVADGTLFPLVPADLVLSCIKPANVVLLIGREQKRPSGQLIIDNLLIAGIMSSQ